MLKNIKSKYIVKIIFSYTNEGPKLKLIGYNKGFQNILDLSIINYKHFTGKYLIVSNGIGKEYYGYNNQIAFEGEYSNGKRNGKRKEFNYIGKLKFEDKFFINNKTTYLSKNFCGEVKEYYKDGKLKFEGKYLKGRKLDGKGYDIFGDLAYQIKEGKGFIKEYHNDEGKKIIFEGDYLNGERNGKGKEYSIINSCLIFEGEYLNGKKNGKGKEYYYQNKLMTFEGEYLNGERNGKGKCYKKN